MSEGKDNDNDTPPEIERKIIEHVVKKPEDFDKIKQERDDLQAKLELLAMKQADEYREKHDIPDDISPSQFDAYLQGRDGVIPDKPNAELPREGTPAKPPKSTTRLRQKLDSIWGKSFDTAQEMVSYVYGVLGNPTSTKEERAICEDVRSQWLQLLSNTEASPSLDRKINDFMTNPKKPTYDIEKFSEQYEGLGENRKLVRNKRTMFYVDSRGKYRIGSPSPEET